MVRVAFTLFAIALLITGGTVLGSSVRELSALSLPVKQYGLLSGRFEEGTMLFVPDIMLGRAVEALMESHGKHVPFTYVLPVLTSYDVAIGNFEGSVPMRHKKTPNNSLQFSIRPEYLTVLRDVGFDTLSLANNHSLDFGEDGYEHTRDACTAASLLCVGHGERVSTSSIARHTVGDTVVTTLMLHADGSTTPEHLQSLVTYMNETSHVQFAFIHWGEEYQLLHSEEQETLAHTLIDYGVDAIIGHHPHVIQDIALYQNRPIFYSLGNFIFDQYFNESVQEGYAVGVTFKEDAVTYTLLPYTMETRSVPKFLEGAERETFLDGVTGAESFKYGEMTYPL